MMPASPLLNPGGSSTLKSESGALTTYLYNAAQELTKVTPPTGQPTTVAWDAAGNMREENAGGARTTYTWDDENRLTKVEAPGGTESYAYAADGKRRKKETAAATRLFLWDQEALLREMDGGLGLVAAYTGVPESWGSYSSQRRGSTSRFFLPDPGESYAALADALGLVTDTTVLTAFGDQIAGAGSTVNPFRYEGEYGYYRDEVSRLYVRARHYQPGRGIWMSVDPLGNRSGTDGEAATFPGGYDPYSYAAGNPVVWEDPSGRAIGHLTALALLVAAAFAAWAAACGIAGMIDSLGVVRTPGLRRWKDRDRLAHCIAACVIRRCGTWFQSCFWGAIKEELVDRLIGHGPEYRDYLANFNGDWCAKQIQSVRQCEACCGLIYPPPIGSGWRPFRPWTPPPGLKFPHKGLPEAFDELKRGRRTR